MQCRITILRADYCVVLSVLFAPQNCGVVNTSLYRSTFTVSAFLSLQLPDAFSFLVPVLLIHRPPTNVINMKTSVAIGCGTMASFSLLPGETERVVW